MRHPNCWTDTCYVDSFLGCGVPLQSIRGMARDDTSRYQADA